MSTVVIDGTAHACTVEDLKRFDEYATKHKCSREEAAAKLLSSSEKKAALAESASVPHKKSAPHETAKK